MTVVSHIFLLIPRAQATPPAGMSNARIVNACRSLLIPSLAAISRQIPLSRAKGMAHKCAQQRHKAASTGGDNADNRRVEGAPAPPAGFFHAGGRRRPGGP